LAGKVRAAGVPNGSQLELHPRLDAGGGFLPADGGVRGQLDSPGDMEPTGHSWSQEFVSTLFVTTNNAALALIPF